MSLPSCLMNAEEMLMNLWRNQTLFMVRLLVRFATLQNLQFLQN